jgi:uncharacterized Zn finger protein (UPF0148 family)
MAGRTCAACGRQDARSAIGGVLLCPHCNPIVLERIDAAHRAGKTADAAKEARALLRETSQDYLLRDIPEDLWQQAKHASVDRGVSLRDLLLAGLRRELGG